MPSISLSLLLLLLSTSTNSITDLNSDQLALLDFANEVPHGRKLNWSTSNPICTSWVGITCNLDNTRVIALRLPGIGLLGPIPLNTLGRLDALQVLSLRSNRLNVNLPPDVPSIPSLHNLYLQHNNLSGVIPKSISSKITFFDISYNSFTGAIPDVIQNLTELSSLYLQNNSLSGTIPELDLPKLKHLNLSFNNLSGSIPFSLRKFPKESFLGNIQLCGAPLPPCAISPSPLPLPKKEKKSFWKRLSLGVIIGIAAAILALLLLLVIILVICILKRRRETENGREAKGKGVIRSEKEAKEEYSSGVQEAEKNKLVFFEGCSYNFDLEDLLRASAEVLGKGSYGTTYKAVLEDGTTVVVKRLKEVAVGKKEFEQQMDVIGRVGQHLNVVPLRAYYYSKDEKLLVYDYMPAGNFSTLLHGNRGEEKTPLSWDARVKIALSSARGISHIHSSGTGKLAHGNIKSNNILLTQDQEACISDFGLASIMTSPATPSRSIAGYRAPETVETRKFTQKSDVYSFGVVLLELLTGKAPLQSPGRDDVVDLPRWVQSVVREEWTAEVFDVDLIRDQNIEEDMVQMLQIAMACVAKAPDQRPRINEVVRMIEEVRVSDSDTRPSSEDKGKEVQTP